MSVIHGASRNGAVAPLITFDLFSALTDSRTGGSQVLDALSVARGWPARGEQVYDFWDRTNKDLQRTTMTWRPFAEHCTEAMASTYTVLGLTGDVRDDTELLLRSVGDWPLWPDVPVGLEQVRTRARIGVLSNVDDDIWAWTRAARLGFAPDDVLTSERLHAYKPALAHLPTRGGTAPGPPAARGQLRPRRPWRPGVRAPNGPTHPARTRGRSGRARPGRTAARNRRGRGVPRMRRCRARTTARIRRGGVRAADPSSRRRSPRAAPR